MRKYLLSKSPVLTLVILLCLTIISCSDDEDDPTNPVNNQEEEVATLAVTPENLDVYRDPGSTTFEVSNTGEGTLSWTASDDADWVTLAPTAGSNDSGTCTTVTASYAENASGDSRACTVTVADPDASDSPQTVTITQSPQGPPVISVTPDRRDVGSEENATLFEVFNTGEATLYWTASDDADWVTLILLTVGTDDGIILASYQANPTWETRFCVITVSAPGASNSPQTVIIAQEGAPSICVAPEMLDVSAGSGQIEFNVWNCGEGTLSWTASDDVDWVTLAPTSGTNSGTITASYAENPTDFSRTCRINVSAAGATNSPQTVVLFQAGIPAGNPD